MQTWVKGTQIRANKGPYNHQKGDYDDHSFVLILLLIGTVFQVSDVAHGLFYVLTVMQVKMVEW